MAHRLPHSLLLIAALFTTVKEARAENSVQIDVQVIAATHDNRGVDARVERLRQRMTKQFSRYSSYQLLSESTVSLTMNQHQTLSLPDNYTLEITPQLIEPSGLIRMHLHVHRGDQNRIVDTVYAISPGKDLVVGGMKHPGGALLVALHHHGR